MNKCVQGDQGGQQLILTRDETEEDFIKTATDTDMSTPKRAEMRWTQTQSKEQGNHFSELAEIPLSKTLKSYQTQGVGEEGPFPLLWAENFSHD